MNSKPPYPPAPAPTPTSTAPAAKNAGGLRKLKPGSFMDTWMSERGILCVRCKRTYTKNASYLRHFNEKHPQLETVYTCPLCYVDFDTFPKFRQHCYLHLISGRYKCDVCDRTFSHRYDLDSHKNASHVKPLSCDKCDKTFTTRPGLNLHVQQHHSAVRPKFTCKECGKTLRSRNGLTKHVQSHKLGRHLVCDLCGERFSQKSNLTIHMKRHRGDETDFACKLCPKTFYSRSKLADHALSHSADRRHSCGICLKTYKSEKYLNLHLRTHTAPKNFACDVCDKTFLSAGHLKQHSNVHREDKAFKCQYCDAGFNNFSNRHKHIRRMHKPKQGKPDAFSDVCDNSLDRVELQELFTVDDSDLYNRLQNEYDENDKEQELELFESYIREQMEGCETRNIPEVPDFNAYSAPIVYDTYSTPVVYDAIGKNVQQQPVNIENDLFSFDDPAYMQDIPVEQSQILEQSNYTDSTEMTPHDGLQYSAGFFSDIPMIQDILPSAINEFIPIQNDEEIRTDESTTSYTSTSLNFSNIDVNVTSDAQYNIWSMRPNSFYGMDQSDPNGGSHDTISNDLMTTILDVGNTENYVILMPTHN